MGGPTGLKNGTESGLFQTLAQLVADTNVKTNTTVSVFELANRGDYYVTATDEGSGVALANGLFANKLATGGGGEANTASNIGTGTGVFASKSGVDLRLKSLKSIGAAVITSDADSVTIDVSAAGGGDMLASTYDPQNIQSDAFNRANHTGTQAISTVAGLQASLDDKLVNVTNGATTGESLASRPVGTTDVFVKRLKAGTNVTLSSDDNSVTINASGGSGEVNTASNIGTGTGLFAQKSGVDLQFKSLKALGAATITSDANSVTIDVTSAGGGDMLASVYDPQNIAADAFARANHTGTQAISTVSGLQTALDGKEDDGTAAAVVSAHVLEPDPHTQYALKSSLAAVATSGAYSDLSGTPTLATVATSGSYNDLTNKPISYIEGTQSLGNTTGAVNVVISNGAYIKAASTGNTTWTFNTSALGANQVASWVLMLTNGGSFTQTFTGAKWGDGTPPTLSTGLDRLVFTYDGTNLIGVLSDKAIA